MRTKSKIRRRTTIGRSSVLSWLFSCLFLGGGDGRRELGAFASSSRSCVDKGGLGRGEREGVIVLCRLVREGVREWF